MQMRSRFGVIALSILFVWISFFPATAHHQHSIAAKSALFLALLVFLIIKRVEIFKFKDYSLWFFIAAMGINVLFARYKQPALGIYMDLAIPMFCVYYLASAAGPEANFRFLLRIICVSGLIVAVLGILEHLTKANIIYERFVENPYYARHIGEFGRIMSTLMNPAVLGSYLLACLPFNFLVCKSKKIIWRIAGWMSLSLCFIAMLLTFSRGAFFAFAAMAVFYLVMRKRYRLLSVFIVVFCAAVAICGRSGYPYSRFGAGILSKHPTSILSDYRVRRIEMALRMVKDSPLTGIGFGHYRFRFAEYDRQKEKANYEHMIADNMYLTLLAETGLIGFFGFILFICLIFKRAFMSLKSAGYRSEEGVRLIAVLAGFTGILFNMAAYELFYWPNIYLYFCLIVGLLKWMPR